MPSRQSDDLTTFIFQQANAEFNSSKLGNIRQLLGILTAEPETSSNGGSGSKREFFSSREKPWNIFASEPVSKVLARS